MDGWKDKIYIIRGKKEKPPEIGGAVVLAHVDSSSLRGEELADLGHALPPKNTRCYRTGSRLKRTFQELIPNGSVSK